MAEKMGFFGKMVTAGVIFGVGYVALEKVSEWPDNNSFSTSVQPDTSRSASQDPEGTISQSPEPDPPIETAKPPAPKPKKPAPDPRKYGTEISLTAQSTGKAVLFATTDLQSIGCVIKPKEKFTKRSWGEVQLFQEHSGLRLPYQKSLPLGPKTASKIKKAKKLNDRSCGTNLHPDLKLPGCNGNMGPAVPGTVCRDGFVPIPDPKNLKFGCPGSFIKQFRLVEKKKVYCDDRPGQPEGYYVRGQMVAGPR